MPLELLTIPCLSDNYAFVVFDAKTREAALIDIPESQPINEIVKTHNLKLKTVLITHHHPDHIQGLEGLENHGSLKIIGAKADAHRLPPLDLAVSEGEKVEVCGEIAQVFDVSGHTNGHIAYHFPTSKLAFTADSLMAMGCGRLFEGTPAQMWDSLKKIRALPKDTLICSGHEYTMANANFAQSLEEANPALTLRITEIEQARAANQPTVPSLLELEIETNPFLRADKPSMMAALGMVGADPAEVFAEVRGRKDRF